MADAARKQSIKAAIKAAAAPLRFTAWRALESVAELSSHASRGALRVQWGEQWNDAFDRALDLLPEIERCPRAAYRQLLAPTSVRKRHALVTNANGEPLALISLRRRAGLWEPVAYQCIPFAIAPARDWESLGAALNALGLDILVFAGLGPEVRALRPAVTWTYDWYEIDLESDYEAYWRKRRRHHRINHARRHLNDLTVRIDGDGDIEWVVEKWREQWADDPDNEVVAAEDRLNFWPALRRENATLSARTLQLLRGETRVGGMVFMAWGDVAMPQVGGREAALDDGNIASAYTIAFLDWAKANGFRKIMLGGGDYKRDWGPSQGVRYGARFCPPLMEKFRWLQSG